LTEQEIRHLFEVQMGARIAELKQSLANDNISYANLPVHQQAALASLLFNGGAKLVGDNIRDGLRAHDDKAVIDNIRYRSNADGLEGLEVRRDFEAALFSGASSLSPSAQLPSGDGNWAKVAFSSAQGQQL
jgi:GH24 family phage-related lysozyme (muramidase)